MFSELGVSGVKSVGASTTTGSAAGTTGATGATTFLTGFLTAGFFAKYYMLLSVMQTGGSFAIWLVIIGVLFAAVSVYYYFKVIQAMYFKEGTPTVMPFTNRFKYALIVLAVIIIVLGVYPDALLGCFYF